MSDDNSKDKGKDDDLSEYVAGETLKLGKKTKVCIFVLILVAVLIIVVPVILVYSLSSGVTEATFNNEEVVASLGLQSIAEGKVACDLQQLIISDVELNGRSFKDYLAQAGFTDCFFTSVQVVSPVTLEPSDVRDLSYLISNRVSQNGG